MALSVTMNPSIVILFSIFIVEALCQHTDHPYHELAFSGEGEKKQEVKQLLHLYEQFLNGGMATKQSSSNPSLSTSAALGGQNRNVQRILNAYEQFLNGGLIPKQPRTETSVTVSSTVAPHRRLLARSLGQKDLLREDERTKKSSSNTRWVRKVKHFLLSGEEVPSEQVKEMEASIDKILKPDQNTLQILEGEWEGDEFLSLLDWKDLEAVKSYLASDEAH